MLWNLIIKISRESGGQISSIFCSSEYDLKQILESVREPKQNPVVKSEEEICSILANKNFVTILKPNEELINGTSSIIINIYTYRTV